MLDLSYSMQGRKLELARQTALVFCEALDRLGIATSVIGFTTADTTNRRTQELSADSGISVKELTTRFRCAPLRHVVVKSFEEPWRTAVGRLPGLTATALTPLGESLLFAARGIA